VHRFERLLAGGMAGGAALALAACGASGTTGASGTSGASGASTPTTTQVAAAIRNATSVRVTGRLTENGTPEALNLSMFTNGDLTGTLSANGQPPVSLIVVNKSVYVLVTAAFLKSAVGSAVSCDGLCGKYISVAGSQASSLTSGLSLTGLLKDFSDLKRAGQSPVGTTTVDGQKAFVFKDTADNATLDVAATGPAYPLRITGQAKSTAATIIFSDWNKVPTPTAPPASDIVDPSKL
jgi:hypothetical protein